MSGSHHHVHAPFPARRAGYCRDCQGRTEDAETLLCGFCRMQRGLESVDKRLSREGQERR